MAVEIVNDDCREFLKWLPDDTFNCVVTSPPYWGLRDYGVAGQMGLEATPDDFVAEMVAVFREVRRCLKPDGTLWLNLGDSYAGSWGAQGHRVTESDDPSWHSSQIKNHPKRARQTGSIRQAGLKAKDLIMIPSRVALALQADGWWVRSEIIWHKPNPMPESIKDRPTSSHEKIFLLSKSERYHYDADAVREPYAGHASGNGFAGRQGGTAHHAKSGGNGTAKEWTPSTGRNLRNVWTIPPKPFKGAHFATFPPALVEPCIKAGCPAGGVVLDPFGGAGTVGLVAQRLGRNALLIELNPDYAKMAEERIAADDR